MPRKRLALLCVLLLSCPAALGPRAVAQPASPTQPAPTVKQGLARVDFNGDQWGDLAIGVPGETVGGVRRAGAVQVLYGGPSGLSAVGNQLWSQESAGVEGQAEPDDLFGVTIAAADFDGDGFGDLAVGVPFEDHGSVLDGGLVHLLYGSPSGLQSTRSQTWSQKSDGVDGRVEAGDMFGLDLAAGQLGLGAQSDLAVGTPGESIDRIELGGAVHVLYGSTRGLTATGSQVWSQNSPGVAGVAEPGDRFGTSLAAANVGRSATHELIIGVPNEALGHLQEAGAVHIISGSTRGLRAAGSQFWSENSRGIGGQAEAFDHFGSELAAADFGRSGYADLAIGARGQALANATSAGHVHVLYGSSAGLAATGSQIWSQSSKGVAGTPERYDNFGFSLAVGNFGGSSGADLAVGVPGEEPGGQDWWGAGAVQLLYGSRAGLSSAGSQQVTQDTPGIRGVGEFTDWFGHAVDGGDFDGNGYDDLAVGARDETIQGHESAGNVHVIAGTASGLTSVGSQLWTQGASGLPGVVEAWDEFGASLAAG